MKFSRIAIAIAALPLLAVACDCAPTGLEAPPTIHRETEPPPPEPVQPDSTSDGGGVKGGGG